MRGIHDDGGGTSGAPLRDGLAQHGFRVRLDRVVDRQPNVAPVHRGSLVHHVEDVSERVDHAALAPGLPGDRPVELQLEPGEPAVVEAGVAEDVRGDRALRIETALLRVEAEACEAALFEQRGLCRLRLALDVDEAALLVHQLAVERVGVDTESLRGRCRNDACVAHLPRICVHRRRLLADRELHTCAVEDRSTGRGEDDHRAVLVRRELRERPGLHGLEPRRPAEQRGEEDEKNGEEEPDPAIDRVPTPAGHD